MACGRHPRFGDAPAVGTLGAVVGRRPARAVARLAILVLALPWLAGCSALDDGVTGEASVGASDAGHGLPGDGLAGDGPTADPSLWTRLPDPPLDGRIQAMVASVDDRVFVAGGWAFLCPPGASCVPPQDPPLADGAALSVATGEWSPIAAAPFGLSPIATAVVGSDVYVIHQCYASQPCEEASALLRYASEDDAWEVQPAPDGAELDERALLVTPEGLVAYLRSDEGGGGSDLRYLASEARWVTMPDDPLPACFDRFMIEHAGRIFLFGSPIENGDRAKLAAVYDPERDAWLRRTTADSAGYQVWGIGERMYLNPHFGPSSGLGGVYDPDSDSWGPLPEPPDATTWRNDIAAIIGSDEAVYAYASGWALDARTDDWIEIARHPDVAFELDDNGAPPQPGSGVAVHDQVIASGPDRSMIVFGGQRWEGGDGELIVNTWQWRPPNE